MAEITRRAGTYGSLWVLLVVVAVGAAVVTSCGSGGGGGSDGELCDQCGDDPDGPCQPSIIVVPGPDQPPPCAPTAISTAPIATATPKPTATSATPSATSATASPTVTATTDASACEVRLVCRRKTDSSQRRCFPVDPNSSKGDVNYQWRCDGSRPGGTPRPEPTPTPTEVTSPVGTVTPSCNNNNVADAGERCDGNDLRGFNNCADFNCAGVGFPICNPNCTFNLSGCGNTCFDNGHL